MLSHGRVLGTHIAEAAPSVLVTRHVIHRPMPRFRESLSGIEMVLKVVEPLIDEIVGAVGKPPSELRGELLQPNLSPFYNNPFDLHIHHNLPSEGVEGHLVIWSELVEPIIAEGGSSGLVIDDEDVFVYIHNPIEMAAEHVLRFWMPYRSEIQIEAKAQLHRRFPIF